MATRATTSRLGFRIPLNTMRRIEQAAAILGQTVSNFAKESLVERAQTVIDEYAVLRLSDRDRDRFLQMLDADPAPNAALVAATRVHCKRVAR